MESAATKSRTNPADRPIDSVIVSPYFGGSSRWDSKPFASIVAVVPDQVVNEKPLAAIHVFRWEDRGYEFADGLLAVKEKLITIGDWILWPELHKALKLPVKDWDGIVKHAKGEPGYLRLKNLEEDDFACRPPPENSEGHALLALQMLQKWNKWNAARAGWNARATDLFSRFESPDHLASTVERIDRLAKNIDLSLRNNTNFDQPWARLLETLKLNELVESKLREKHKLA